MAGSSLLLLIDDIAAALDDVALMTKIAAKQTAGVLGDDLALNAEQVAGVRAERELPVVWAVAKGSLKNKAILVPAALLISIFFSPLILPLLMVGGAYLCYEGFEKIVHKFLHSGAEQKAEGDAFKAALNNPDIDLIEFEKEKIQGAIRTDFVLSAEIIVITLGAVAQSNVLTQAAAVVSVAVIMTIGVYGFVGFIVKLDDIGIHFLMQQGNGGWIRLLHRVGRVLLVSAPVLMRALAVLGTVAMFLVGGGIIVHGLPLMGDWVHQLTRFAHSDNVMLGLLAGAISAIANIAVGVLSGGLTLVLVTGLSAISAKVKS